MTAFTRYVQDLRPGDVVKMNGHSYVVHGISDHCTITVILSCSPRRKHKRAKRHARWNRSRGSTRPRKHNASWLFGVRIRGN